VLQSPDKITYTNTGTECMYCCTLHICLLFKAYFYQKLYGKEGPGSNSSGGSNGIYSVSLITFVVSVCIHKTCHFYFYDNFGTYSFAVTFRCEPWKKLFKSTSIPAKHCVFCCA